MIINSQNIGKDAGDLLEFCKESNAIEEVYDDNSLTDALDTFAYLVTKEEITPAIIVKAHAILMERQDLEEKYKGHFRTIPVYIGGKEASPAGNIPSAIAQWCEIVKSNIQAQNKESWRMAHISFERIHPFVDGNGRIGRLLLNWQRLQLKLPILVIKEKERFTYYKWFQ